MTWPDIAKDRIPGECWDRASDSCLGLRVAAAIETWGDYYMCLDKDTSLVLAREVLLLFGKEKETFAPNAAISITCKKKCFRIIVRVVVNWCVWSSKFRKWSQVAGGPASIRVTYCVEVSALYFILVAGSMGNTSCMYPFLEGFKLLWGLLFNILHLTRFQRSWTFKR